MTELWMIKCKAAVKELTTREVEYKYELKDTGLGVITLSTSDAESNRDLFLGVLFTQSKNRLVREYVFQ